MSRHDGQSIITSAANDHGIPHLFRIPMDGRSPSPFVSDYSLDPTWSPDGRLVLYSGPDIGTTFSVKAVSADASPHPLPTLTLTPRSSPPGLPSRSDTPSSSCEETSAAQGSLAHRSRHRRRAPVDQPPPDFDVRDFDLSRDGREVVLERVQERSDLVLIDRTRP